MKSAFENSLRLFKTDKAEYCEVYKVIGLIFCSKCTTGDCSQDKFFTECLKSIHLCENISTLLDS